MPIETFRRTSSDSLIHEARQPVRTDEMEGYLGKLGHRNWIILADAAYPCHSNPSIETSLYAGDLLAALDDMLHFFRNSTNVRPRIYFDSELPYVAEAHAPGIGKFRKDLLTRIEPYSPVEVNHELLVLRVDEVARHFKVLVLKTQSMFPYTSVFLELECGYWSEEAEADLRLSVPAPPGSPAAAIYKSASGLTTKGNK